jgi:beta-1,4-mannosyltransferase
LKIAFYPFDTSGNKYIEIMKECISMNGFEVLDLKSVFNNKKLLKEVDYVHFNWFESIYTNSYASFIKNFIKKMSILIWLLYNKRKIVWTMHNKMPHSTYSFYMSRFLMRFIAKHAYKIVIHSSQSKEALYEITNNKNIENKIILIEHPNYIDSYPISTSDYRRELKIDDNSLVFLFVGAVNPYKNIEVLIKAFKLADITNSRLIIAGRPVNENYRNELLKTINNDTRIITLLEFISDDDITKLLNTCDIMVLPYDLQSSLNSGSVFLSFSNQKTVISTENGTINDIKDHAFCFSYDYKDEKDHIDILTQKIIEINKLNETNPQSIKDMGLEAYDFVKKNNSKESISKKLKNLYKDIK